MFSAIINDHWSSRTQRNRCGPKLKGSRESEMDKEKQADPWPTELIFTKAQVEQQL